MPSTSVSGRDIHSWMCSIEIAILSLRMFICRSEMNTLTPPYLSIPAKKYFEQETWRMRVI